jgi:hypothetical protein
MEEVVMKNFILVVLCSLFLIQSANALEQPSPKKDRSWKKIACYITTGSVASFFSYQYNQLKIDEKILADNARAVPVAMPYAGSSDKKWREYLEHKEKVDYHEGRRQGAQVFTFLCGFLALASFAVTHQSLQTW